MSIYEQGLAPAPVNHVALSPLSFIERTASIYPERLAVIHGAIRRDWRETYRRCRRLASALAGRGIGRGDTVAVMLPNITALAMANSAPTLKLSVPGEATSSTPPKPMTSARPRARLMPSCR